MVSRTAAVNLRYSLLSGRGVQYAVCNGLEIRTDNKHVSPWDISCVPGRCPVQHTLYLTLDLLPCLHVQFMFCSTTMRVPTHEVIPCSQLLSTRGLDTNQHPPPSGWASLVRIIANINIDGSMTKLLIARPNEARRRCVHELFAQVALRRSQHIGWWHMVLLSVLLDFVMVLWESGSQTVLVIYLVLRKTI